MFKIIFADAENVWSLNLDMYDAICCLMLAVCPITEVNETLNL